MAPKPAAAPPPPRLDLPAAMAVLANPPDATGDPTLLPQAMTFLVGFNLGQLPQDIEVTTQLVTLVVPYVCASALEPAVAAAAIKLLGKLAVDGRMQETWCQPACMQALWDVLSSFHAHYDGYVARLAALAAEAAEAGGTGRGTPAKDAKAAKGAPVTPVDPESTLPGPSKFALDAVMAALSAVLTSSGSMGAEAVGGVVGPDVEPLLTLLRHNSCRIQVLTLRLLRLLLRSDAVAAALTASNAAAALTGLLVTSPHGAVREEALTSLGYLAAASAPSMQQGLDAGLPLLLLAHMLDPTTGAVPPPPPDVGDPLPEGEEALPPPPPPPPLDFTRPVHSSPEKLQDLASDLLLQLAKHHQGVAQQLLRLGGMQLLLAALPAPLLPEPPPPPPKKRPSSAADTIFAGMLAGGTGGRRVSVPPTPEQVAPPAAKDAWVPYLEGPAALPLPAAAVTSPALQATLLLTLSCMLAEPGVQDYWWSVHATHRHHLQLAFLLQPDALPPTPPPPPPLADAASTVSVATAAAPPAPQPRVSQPGKAAPQDPLLPPFPPAVRAAALHCLLQLSKHPQWLALAPFLTALQATVRAGADGTSPSMIAPLAEIMQRVLTARRPPPPRAAAAAAAGAAANGDVVVVAARPNVDDNRLPLEANGLAEEAFSTVEITESLKGLARLARKGNDPWATSAVAAALMVLPDEALFAPPWPPLPSPPPTPPPPPLPTSQFLWDALGRPVMTDGIKLVHL